MWIVLSFYWAHQHFILLFITTVYLKLLEFWGIKQRLSRAERSTQQFHVFGVLFDCGSNGSDWAHHHWLWFNAFFHLVQGHWDYWIRDSHFNTVINVSSHSTRIHTFLLKVYCTQHWCGLHGDVSVHTEACPLWSSQCSAAAADIHPGALFQINVCYTKDKPWPVIARVFFLMNSNTAHSTWLKEECWQKALACCSSSVQRISPLILHWIRVCVYAYRCIYMHCVPVEVAYEIQHHLETYSLQRTLPVSMSIPVLCSDSHVPEVWLSFSVRHSEHWGWGWGRCETVMRHKLLQLHVTGSRVLFVRSVVSHSCPVTRCRSPALAYGSLCVQAYWGRGPRYTGSQPATWGPDPPRHKTWTSHSHG